MINENYIKVADLCTLQFREPLEYGMYPEQTEMYIPKITEQELKVQVLVAPSVVVNGNLYIQIIKENGVVVLEKTFAISTLLLGTYYYATVTFTANEIAAIAENTICYFSILDVGTEIASSVWYEINPVYKGDLKKITYGHGENDYNVIFLTGTEFSLTVEAGFVPIDSRDEQDTEDFIEQNMTNQTVYGDEYEVVGLTLGDGNGIPNWLRKKISRASLLDTFKVDGTEYVRVQGSKMEKVTDTYKGLAVYKIDLQTTINYLQ